MKRIELMNQVCWSFPKCAFENFEWWWRQQQVSNLFSRVRRRCQAPPERAIYFIIWCRYSVRFRTACGAKSSLKSMHCICSDGKSHGAVNRFFENIIIVECMEPQVESHAIHLRLYCSYMPNLLVKRYIEHVFFDWLTYAIKCCLHLVFTNQ